MKKFLVFVFCFQILLQANETSELFKKAQEFENIGDTVNAMRLYKQIAQNSLNQQNQILNNNDTNTTVAIVKPEQNLEKLILQNSQEPKDDEIQNILGLRLYHLNYLLPVSYSQNKPTNGKSRFETKFQFSVQKPLMTNAFKLNETLGIAYTQTSWWQTSSDSAPFRESNYKPEIYIDFDTQNSLKMLNISNIRAGLLHESNGKDKENSRSWNRLYAQARFDLGTLSVTPRIWSIVGDTNDNKNIENYIGVGDVNFSFAFKDHILNTMIRNNLHFDKTNRGAAQFDWLFPIFSTGIYGYVQFFTGYGESLIDYNKHTNKIAVGFTLLR
ncbi:phospholipase A [Campylobacter sp. 7477a]|uniref:phospholipase A n=1 Tax=Campylobacter sp. 7477a TaxID=2735741 RepID=UPI0030145FD0|nr:phospholipase A [Campylobacter sp. 7477a]